MKSFQLPPLAGISRVFCTIDLTLQLRWSMIQMYSQIPSNPERRKQWDKYFGKLPSFRSRRPSVYGHFIQRSPLGDPQGNDRAGQTAGEAALNEAWEEAGLVGLWRPSLGELPLRQVRPHAPCDCVLDARQGDGSRLAGAQHAQLANGLNRRRPWTGSRNKACAKSSTPCAGRPLRAISSASSFASRTQRPVQSLQPIGRRFAFDRQPATVFHSRQRCDEAEPVYIASTERYFLGTRLTVVLRASRACVWAITLLREMIP